MNDLVPILEDRGEGVGKVELPASRTYPLLPITTGLRSLPWYLPVTRIFLYDSIVFLQPFAPCIVICFLLFAGLISNALPFTV